VNRFESRDGICRTNALPVVSAHQPHFGEEAVPVGHHGSGTIFFTACSLRCVFCQNWEISHLRLGTETSHHRLAEMMMELQGLGCHNINLVTPTHMVPQILAALPNAIEMGLSLPHPEIARPITAEEFEEALQATRQEGIQRLDRDIGRRFRRRQPVGL
jgi:putative pyruvate formate lyase activating enzyme